MLGVQRQACLAPWEFVALWMPLQRNRLRTARFVAGWRQLENLVTPGRQLEVKASYSIAGGMVNGAVHEIFAAHGLPPQLLNRKPGIALACVGCIVHGDQDRAVVRGLP